MVVPSAPLRIAPPDGPLDPNLPQTFQWQHNDADGDPQVAYKFGLSGPFARQLTQDAASWASGTGVDVDGSTGALRLAQGGEFDPTTLYAATEGGGWYDPSDLSTLWQDTAGTVPVTADGQPVARIDDKSGNGNHLTGSGTVYRTDGSRHWLEGGTLSGGSVTLQADWTLLVAGQNNAYNGMMVALEGSSTDYIRVSPYVSANRLMLYTRLSSYGVGQVSNYDNSVPYGTDTLVHVTVTPGSQSIRQNDNPVQTVANAWTTETMAGSISIINNATAMRWYGGIFIDRQLTAQEEADARMFLEGRRDGVDPWAAASGTWTSPPLDLATLGEVPSSLVDWQASVPTGTSVTVETSVDSGATWQLATDGGPIAGATPGGTVQARITLTSDGTTTPEVASLLLEAGDTSWSDTGWVASSAQSHTEPAHTFTGGSYNWRVATQDNDGESPWSDIGTFVTERADSGTGLIQATVTATSSGTVAYHLDGVGVISVAHTRSAQGIKSATGTGFAEQDVLPVVSSGLRASRGTATIEAEPFVGIFPAEIGSGALLVTATPLAAGTRKTQGDGLLYVTDVPTSTGHKWQRYFTAPGREVYGSSNRFWRRVHIEQGITVIKRDGAFIQVEHPSADDFANADKIYVGGHLYQIDDLEHLDLEAAGYTTFYSEDGR